MPPHTPSSHIYTLSPLPHPTHTTVDQLQVGSCGSPAKLCACGECVMGYLSELVYWGGWEEEETRGGREERKAAREYYNWELTCTFFEQAKYRYHFLYFCGALHYIKHLHNINTQGAVILWLKTTWIQKLRSRSIKFRGTWSWIFTTDPHHPTKNQTLL